MGSTYLSPGVYTTIKDFSFFVRGASTTRAGIVTTADRGPVSVPTLITSQAQLLEVFGNPTTQHMGLFSALQYLNRGTALEICRVGLFNKSGDLLGTDLFDECSKITAQNTAGTPVDTMTFYAVTPGDDFDGMKVIIQDGNIADTFTLQVEFEGVAVERFENLSVDPTDSRYAEKVVNDLSSLEVSSYVRVDYLPADEGLPALGTYTLTGGANGTAGITDAEYIGTPLSALYNGNPSGMQVFRDREKSQISMLATPGISSAAVINAAGVLMDYRDTGIYLIDPPQGLDVQNVIDWHNGAGAYSTHSAFNSKRYAIYWPWLEVYDEFGKQNIWTPPCGHAMAQWAYTDGQFEPWFAPAGLQRGHLGLPLRAEFNPDQGQRDALYGNGNAINPIRTFQTQGLNIWGQKTALRLNSALASINVMRLTDFIKDSIAASSLVLDFEQNDSVLWNQFIDMVEPFLKDVASRRGLEDFRVVADETTTTAQKRNNLTMNAKVMFIPTKVAENIVIDFALFPSGAEFADPATF